MTRGKVLQIKEEDYIHGHPLFGARDTRILLCHVLINAPPVIIVIATMRMASLDYVYSDNSSYLGLGSPPPTPEWGGMISIAKDYVDRPSLIIIPGGRYDYRNLF